jgi:MFS family permease
MFWPVTAIRFATAPFPTRPARESRTWILLASLGIVFFVLLTLYGAVLGVLLPNQIQNIDPGHKTQNFAIVFAITSVFSTLTTPVAGALSDRTCSRMGRRSPWILLGGLTGGGALMLVPCGGDIAVVTALWVVAAIALNAMQPAVTAIVADRFAVAGRGLASGVVGAAMTAGVSAGAIYGGLMAGHLALAYRLLGVAIMLACGSFVLLNPDPDTAHPAPRRFRLAEFARGFWIDPRRHPDFAWAFASRFMIYLGYQAVLTYLFYVLQDYVGLGQGEANRTIARLSSITLVVLLASGLCAGWLSDRWRRRKPLVVAGGLTMGAAVAAPLVAPTISGMAAYAALIGLGYGTFMAVDLALMTQVLPVRDGGEDSTGRDLGILTTAINVPQIISPVVAAWLLSATHGNYAMLFLAACTVVIVGAFLVLPIRSIR